SYTPDFLIHHKCGDSRIYLYAHEIYHIFFFSIPCLGLSAAFSLYDNDKSLLGYQRFLLHLLILILFFCVRFSLLLFFCFYVFSILCIRCLFFYIYICY